MMLRTALVMACATVALAGLTPARSAVAGTYLYGYGNAYAGAGVYLRGYGGHGSRYNFNATRGGRNNGSFYSGMTGGRGVSDPLGYGSGRRASASQSPYAYNPPAPLWLKSLMGGNRERPLCGTYNRVPTACRATTTRYVADVLRQD